FIMDPTFEFNFIKKLLPVALIFVCALPIKNIYILKYSFIISVFLAVIISFIKLSILFIESNDFQFADGAIVNNTLVLERIYIGFMVCISVIFSFEIIN